MQAIRAYYEREKGDRLTRRLFGVIRRMIETHDRDMQHNILELLRIPRL